MEGEAEKGEPERMQGLERGREDKGGVRRRPEKGAAVHSGGKR